MTYRVRDMNTGHVLGTYPTADDAKEVLRAILEKPNIPHWLQLVEVHTANETLIAVGRQLDWEVFGGQAVRPLIALDLHYLLNREEQLAIWMPQIAGELFGQWVVHQKAIGDLVSRFIEHDGVVADADFFDDLERLSDDAYDIAQQGRQRKLGAEKEVEGLADFHGLNRQMRDWYKDLL